MGNAEVVANRSALYLLGNIDRIANPNVSFSDIPDTAMGYDIGVLSPTDFLSIDAVGLSITDMLAKTGRDVEASEDFITSVTVGGETLNITRYGEGVTVTFALAGHEKDFEKPVKPVAITEKITERFAKSPAHRAVHKLHEANALQANAATTEAFDPYEDSLGTLAFMYDLGLVHGLSVSREMRSGTNAEALVKNAIEGEPPHAVQRDETDSSITLTFGNDVVKTITYDKQSGAMKLTITKNPQALYPEKANQSSAESLPFIETQAAAELYGLLDGAGLMFHPEFETEITRTGEAERFGSVYTQISREVAKWVNRPSRMRVDSLFVPYDPSVRTGIGAEVYERSTAQNYQRKVRDLDTTNSMSRISQIHERIAAMDVSEMSEPTRVLIGMVQDCIARTDSVVETDLKVTQSDIQIDGGACFDVAAYYIGAAGDRVGLTKINVDGVPMLEKNHGKHTFMLLGPAKLNGVRLPKGTLMQRGDDGGWAMLRLTPFSFDNPVDQLATGSEISKALRNEQRALLVIGGTALSRVAAFATKS